MTDIVIHVKGPKGDEAQYSYKVAETGLVEGWLLPDDPALIPPMTEWRPLREVLFEVKIRVTHDILRPKRGVGSLTSRMTYNKDNTVS